MNRCFGGQRKKIGQRRQSSIFKHRDIRGQTKYDIKGSSFEVVDTAVKPWTRQVQKFSSTLFYVSNIN